MSGITWGEWLNGLREHLAREDRGLAWALRLGDTLSFGKTVDREKLEAEVPPILAEVSWGAPLHTRRSSQLAWLHGLAPKAPLGYESIAGGLDDDDLIAVLGKSAMQAVVELDLQNNGLTDRGVRAVAECPRLGELRTLRVCQEPAVGDESAVALAESATLPKLRFLDLSDTGVGDEGAIALAGSASLAGLETLRLKNTAVGDRGRTALAASEHLSAEVDFGG